MNLGINLMKRCILYPLPYLYGRWPPGQGDVHCGLLVPNAAKDAGLLPEEGEQPRRQESPHPHSLCELCQRVNQLGAHG
jgi:hypothetical protein